MKRENFYRRDPGLALAGMQGMTLEERGAYNTILDLLYLTWRPIEDNAAYIAAHCGCAVQKLNPILRRLIEAGKLVRFTEAGQSYISNPHFESERLAVKGSTGTRSGRTKVGQKSGEVEEKSSGVDQNWPLHSIETEQKQSIETLEKSRVDETRQPPIPPSGGVSDEVFDEIWKAYPQAGRQTCAKPLGRQAVDDAVSAGCDAALMLAAAQAIAGSDYAKGGGKPKRFDRWVTQRLFLGADDNHQIIAASPWDGPAAILAAVERGFGDPREAASYLRSCAWREADRAIVSSNGFAVEIIIKRAGSHLQAAGARVLLERKAA